MMEMVRRDCRRDSQRSVNELDGVLGRNVLEHDLQAGEVLHQLRENALDERRLAVEHVDVGICHFAVDAQHHPDPLHALEHRIDAADVGDSAGTVGGRASRIELGRNPHSSIEAACDFVRAGVIGEVAGHQRGEALACGGDNAVAIGARGFDVRDRRDQIGHHDRPRELSRGEGGDRSQHLAVAQMDVPVVGPADGQRLRCHAAAP